MAQPVWVLSVDLQTRTATFQTGMADAAKSARGAFSEIKTGAQGMSGAVGEAAGATNYSMGEARHGVMMLGEEFGIHLPRGITSFIASIGPVGAAMEAAFPFLAIALGATLLIEHLAKVQETANKAAESQTKAFDSASKSLDEATAKSLELKIKLAQLVGGPTTDLEKKLRSVRDILASMKLAPELKQQFKELADGMQVPSAMNPLNWLGNARNAIQGVKDETNSASLAISNAVTLEEKQEHASTELWVAERRLAAMRKSGSEAGIEDQKKLIRMLEVTKDTLGQDVGNKKTEKSVADHEKADKAARDEDEKSKAKEVKLDHRFKIEVDYAKKSKDAALKAVADKEQLAEMELHATDAVMGEIAKAQQERDRRAEEAGRNEAEQVRKMGTLAAASEQEQAQHRSAMHRVSDQVRLAEELHVSAELYQVQMRASAVELGALDKNGKDYENRLKQIQNRELALTRAHENQVTQIKNKSEEERNSRILSGEKHLQDALASSMAQTMMRHQSFGAMISSIGSQIAEGMTQNALKAILANDMTKPSDAKAAARKGWLKGEHFPFPLNTFMPAVLAAAGFASVMAFAEGGIVPGTGNRDTVPAMLTPGEGVIPKRVMEGLGNARNSGGSGDGQTTHVHMHQHINLSAIDATGVGKMFDKHADVVEHSIRKMLRKQNL